MSMLTGTLNQTAVYWGGPENDGRGGYTFVDSEGPTEQDVRWEDKQELFINPLGKESLSRAIAYVDRDMEVGGYLFLGNMGAVDAFLGIDVGVGDDDADVIGGGDEVVDAGVEDPRQVTGAMRIMAFQKLPDLHNIEYVRKVWLQ